MVWLTFTCVVLVVGVLWYLVVRKHEGEIPPRAVESTPAPPNIALNQGLVRTRTLLRGLFDKLFADASLPAAQLLERIEEVLLTADVGVQFTSRVLADIKTVLPQHQEAADLQKRVQAILEQRLVQVFDAVATPATARSKPHVILFVGVNGVGKTTSIGKIAAYMRSMQQTVMLGAGDTYRAAAQQQLAIWAERTSSRIITGAEKSDPASVIYNATKAAVDEAIDVLLLDTAGRLHTNVDLMNEIKKVKRSIEKVLQRPPDETWLVVDATTGQNALQQAREFHAALGLTGVVLTKLDGTAKGGVVVAITDDLKIPVRFVGLGEGADDLQAFDAKQFVTALCASGESV